jgi:hypothetical protein
MWRGLGVTLLVTVVGTLVVFPPLRFAVRCLPVSPPFDELRRDGEGVISAVERYRAENGRYPESLVIAGVVPPESPCGPWQYELNPDGKSFCLSIGDYGRDGFIYFYSSGSGSWYADT